MEPTPRKNPGVMQHIGRVDARRLRNPFHRFAAYWGICRSMILPILDSVPVLVVRVGWSVPLQPVMSVASLYGTKPANYNVFVLDLCGFLTQLQYQLSFIGAKAVLE